MQYDYALFFSDLGDLIGIIAFAIAGILAADGKRVDPVGIFVLAFTTAFGGGILRDIIIDNRPFWWVNHEIYVWLTLGLTAFAPGLIRHFRDRINYSAFVWADAIGLGFFSASGTSLAMAKGFPLLTCTLLGVATGAAGGMLRDVFLNRLPLVLSDRKPYASAAFVGCWLYVVMILFDVDHTAAIWISSFFICFFRMFCWYYDWEIRYEEDESTPVFEKDHQPKHKLKLRARKQNSTQVPATSQIDPEDKNIGDA